MCEQASGDLVRDPDVIPLNERRRLVQQALDTCSFPPQTVFPESVSCGASLASFFSRPVLVWVPEARRRWKRPFCVDVGYKYNVLYVKYQCARKVASGKARTFLTLSSSFLEANPDVAVHLPFVISKKMGFSKGLMEHVHEGILSPNGFSRALIGQKYRENAAYLPPIPPTVDAYLEKNKVVSQSSMTDAWLAYTELYGSLCEVVMKQTKVKKVLRADHSVKFCKRLKLWSGHGQRDNLADAKILLLLQNEIGQIVGRRLTSSENKDETMQLLSDVRPQLDADGDCYLISDKAAAVRKFVVEALGDSVVVKQDPSERCSSNYLTLFDGPILSRRNDWRFVDSMTSRAVSAVEFEHLTKYH
ncbi:hypothetical protein PHYSODRAFT_561630 [Phytophthora sojae]|uniref:Uncharacterized protein n=1 Tax=Phytophthora sojae (strain P6497) TaxID=1094619 RepID=G4ZKG7_PHYSP|nr:hypothetical protein PHYSODRAFT_561630 [Phytophthora sojae]EGZ15909.1 hypothetical protein PHYSODRAFT_561630 [Phytophthora sojae]|eukprot:XP_009529658.1 hypothetical protein PHYSODRAFT_561630 [Phytophthora sojae]